MSRVYETAIKIGATISRAFRSDTYNAAAAVTKLAAATKQLKEADKAAAAFKKLDGEVGRAKARYDVASSALRKLEEAERAAGGATAESTKWRKAGAREVAAAARQLDRATKAAQKNSEALQKLGVDSSKLASEQQRLARALAATERQEKALASYEKSRERLLGARSKTPLMQKAGAQMRGIASDAMFLGTAAGGAAVALGALVVKTIKTGDEIGDTADKLGIAATALQELRYGARQSGAEVGSLDKAVAKMAINIGKAKMAKGKGGGGMLNIPGAQMLASTADAAGAVVDPFAKIGLKAKDLAKLKPDEQLKKIADGMAKLKTQADRAAVGQLIFGKGITDILPFLAEGSAGIERLSKDAHKYGGVLSEEAIKNADLADKAMRDAEMAVAGLTSTLTADLLPVATDVFKSFSGWVASNRAQIKQWSETAAKWITGKGIPAFKNLAVEGAHLAGTVLRLINGAARLTGGFGNLAMVVAGVRLAPTAVTLGKIGIEATKAALALYRYAAASGAAKAAGGPGGGLAAGATAAGKAMGVAAQGAMLVGALAVGYAIGTALDEYLGASDKIAGWLGKITGQDAKLKKIEDTGVEAHDLMLQRKKLERDARIRSFQAQGFSQGQATYLADHPGDVGNVRPISSARGGGSMSVHAPINIGDGATKADATKAARELERKMHDAIDKRDAHRKRVGYGG